LRSSVRDSSLFENGLATIRRVHQDLVNFQPVESEVGQIKKILLANLFVNAMQVHHLATKMGNEIVADVLSLARVLFEQYEMALSERTLHESFLMRFYRLYFLVCTASPMSKIDKNWLASSSNEVEIGKHGVTAYDRKRFADLVERISE
jgi:hypothetical protein